jgi:uroporphyrinogen-III synthase
MRVLITRPAEDAEVFAARLRELGHDVLNAPLLSMRFHDGPPLVLDAVDGILATSANGVRALARRMERRDIPLYAVGPQTAEAARQAGFEKVESADGDVAALAKALPQWVAPGAKLLHATGAEGEGRLASLLADKGYDVRSAVLYDVVASTALPEFVIRALSDHALDAAFFFSPRSAKVFAECIAEARLTEGCARLTVFCISEATAAGLAPLGFASCRIAARPNQDALLACLDE